jgi:hypothetical protein
MGLTEGFDFWPFSEEQAVGDHLLLRESLGLSARNPAAMFRSKDCWL